MRILPALLHFCLCISSLLHAAEPSTAPVLCIEAGMHSGTIRRISADKAGRLALTVSDDKTARIWELPSGRLLRVLHLPVGDGTEGKLSSCALSPDGTLAVVGGYLSGYLQMGLDYSLYAFDTATGRLIRRIARLKS